MTNPRLTNSANRSGSSRQGTLERVSYQDLVGILGEPNLEDDGEKVHGGWVLQTSHGVASIYSYRDENWTDATSWSIGGTNPETAAEITEYIEGHMARDEEA